MPAKNSSSNLIAGAAVSLAFLFTPVTATATLIGDSVDFRIENCCEVTVFSDSAVVVEGSSEFAFDSGAFTVTSDVEASSIEVVIEGSGFDTLTIVTFWEDLDWVNDPSGFVTGVSGTQSSSGVTGDGVLDFGNDWVSLTTFIDVESSGFTFDYLIALETSHLPTPVPEPTTLTLMGIGLAGLGFAARRRKRRLAA